MPRFVYSVIGLFFFSAACSAGGPEDGVYFWYTDGKAPRIKRNDGAEVILGHRLAQTFGKASFRSVKNDNSQFVLEMKGAGPVGQAQGAGGLLVVIDGIIAGVWGQSDRGADGRMDLSCTVYGEEAAKKVAQRLKIDLPLRKHPGHRFEIRWTPEKESYEVGEPITLKLQIRNTGKVPFSFMAGGQQRGARDNQFRFLAYRSYGGGKAVPDTGDPVNFGGIGSVQTLAPGETFTRSVGIEKWFKLDDPDYYRITGMYELRLHDTEMGASGRSIWDDLAVGDCLVRVVAKK